MTAVQPAGPGGASADADRDHPAVLLLRLAAPLQAWGARVAVNRRETHSEPTKSGVVGLLAAALGRDRDDPLGELLALRLGVRVDVPGTLLRDYHTISDYRGRPLPQSGVSAGGVQRPTQPAKHTHVTSRYYLQDATFLAALAGPRDLLVRLDAAVRAPVFPLALGRRSCPPTQPLALGVHDGTLTGVLRAHPWQATARARRQYAARAGRERGQDGPHHPARIPLAATVESPPPGPGHGFDLDEIRDAPLSFDPHGRRFTTRWVRHDWYDVPTGFPAPSDATTPGPDPAGGPGAGHDPFAFLGR
ncbi:type I-E CRISPR-associated protein Cas5/CasD [Streptomyces sp. 796.1]|uniref:type I-E CRISPR-associated protein Cas5/CasD n=1 Tax=Streptomyces sp. 796.1 TaxID=3163029 RepID=UPI0039C9DA3C